MNHSFRVYKDSAILNRALEFQANLIWTEMHIFRLFWTSIKCKNGIKPSKVNSTRMCVIDDIQKIKLAAE